MKSIIDNTKKAGRNMEHSFRQPSASSTGPGSRHTGTTMGNAGETGTQQPAQQRPLKLVVNKPAPVVEPKSAPAPVLPPVQQQAAPQKQERPAFSAGIRGGLTQAPQPAPVLSPAQEQVVPQELERPTFSAGVQDGLTQAPQRQRKEKLSEPFKYAPEGLFPDPTACDEIVEAAKVRELQQAQQPQIGAPQIAMAA